LRANSELQSTNSGFQSSAHGGMIEILRLNTCGSVDDGKSTLVGRLLHDSKAILADQLEQVARTSAERGFAHGAFDFALLTDGLRAEREQGITIDVAYRYFSTARRKFIIADTPGHVQYTRNMVTGASTAQLAVILVDARHGVLAQTKRHSYIASLLGIRHVVVAVNKMDLVGFSQQRFDEIRDSYTAFASKLDIVDPYFLPMSALKGDNVVDTSGNMEWFDGDPLMRHLETVDVRVDLDLEHLRMPVQLVIRPDLDFRGFAGQIASGVLRPGDPVIALPSGVSSTVDRIVTFDGDLEVAGPGRSVTVLLTDEIDVSRGDLLVGPGDGPHRGHDLDAMVVWMAEDELQPGRQYLLQSVNGASNASVSTIHHRVDVDTLEIEDAKTLALNDIARCTVVVDREVLFDRYRDNRVTGSFILVDRLSNATVAAGMIVGRAASWEKQPDEKLTRQRSDISLDERIARYDQKPATVLLTGLTGSGKSTIALALERRLFDRGRTTLRLDGENVRLGISRDLGFSAEDRSENLRRASEIARFANNQGIITIMALVSPQAEARQRARELISDERFVEVFVDAPVEVCRQRDAKGMYDAADRGEIDRFPGVDAPYEPPTDPTVHLDTTALSVDECVEAILDVLAQRNVLPRRR
ncbi:MAG TPA: sulfate adenylyltransferase subunit CysN, partial [Nitriliruptorales bacterium]